MAEAKRVAEAPAPPAPAGADEVIVKFNGRTAVLRPPKSYRGAAVHRILAQLGVNQGLAPGESPDPAANALALADIWAVQHVAKLDGETIAPADDRVQWQDVANRLGHTGMSAVVAAYQKHYGGGADLPLSDGSQKTASS